MSTISKKLLTGLVLILTTSDRVPNPVRGKNIKAV
jgi:hypothetical protein